MAFRFPLAALLRHRQVQERQQQVLMQQANFRVEALRRLIEETQEAVAAIAACSDERMQSGARAAELQFDEIRLETLAERRQTLEAEMAEAEKARTLRHQALQHAHQQREVVDTLRTRQLQNYQEQQRRQDQRSLDDLFLLRRWNR